MDKRKYDGGEAPAGDYAGLTADSDYPASGLMGSNLIYFPVIYSTMDAARDQAIAKASEGTVILAETQTGGKGRLSRTWISPSGNVFLSVLLYPEKAALPYLTMLAAVALARAIEKQLGLPTGLKWPNDVLIGGKKVAGILLETNAGGRETLFAVMGIGINVNIAPGEYEAIATTAVSLTELAGAAVSRRNLVKALLREINSLYGDLGDGADLFTEWRQRLATLGSRVTITAGKEIVEGVAEEVNPDGSLMLRLDDHTLRRIVAGDLKLRHK
ncbi:biotin--[acetyl-CoA-carboxylase] ligase [Chloroflexota bacterium]